MENQIRQPRAIQNQENVYAGGVKNNLVYPTKRMGLSVRGPLGDLNANVDINIGKVALSAAEYEKKASSKVVVKSNYSHVQSKIDTGRSAKTKSNQPARPVLRREESTAGLSAKARTRAAIKETQKQSNEMKENINILLPPKKLQDNKKPAKLQSIKEVSKTNLNLKPILKDPTESLGKLKLAEQTNNEKSKLTEKAKEVNLEDFIIETPKLPDDIEDIDADDVMSPLLMAVYIKDIYRYLADLELKYPIEYDHLKKQSVITGRMRATLIDWLVEVQRQFNLVLETFQLTVAIIDRYLQVVPNVKRNQLQLVGVTAMYLASKYEEIYAPDVADFVYVTDNAYSKADLFQCERDIMAKLGFCLSRPIPLSFLRRFIKAAHGSSKNHNLAKYLVDLSLVEYTMAHYRPSELAAAAICLSLYLLSNHKLEEVWTPTLSYYSGYSLKQIEPIIGKLSKVVTNVEGSKYKAVYNKYMDQPLGKVSTLPELRSGKIHDLAKLAPSS